MAKTMNMASQDEAECPDSTLARNGSTPVKPAGKERSGAGIALDGRVNEVPLSPPVTSDSAN
jgi:hypothetical protein